MSKNAPFLIDLFFLSMFRFVNVLLPPAARQEGVRVRWWQPQHDGADHSDWALDNVLIAGSDPRAQISDTFGGVALPNHERAPADGTSGRIGQPSEQEETPIGISESLPPLIIYNNFTLFLYY